VLAVAGIFLFLVGFGFGYGSLVWVYVAESLPAQMRSIGGSALLTADLFGNIIIGFFFLNAMAAIGGTATFGIFLALSVVAFVFVAVLAPETKCRPLEDIRFFWANRGHWPSPSDRPAEKPQRPVSGRARGTA
jgi:MFS family permease